MRALGAEAPLFQADIASWPAVAAFADEVFAELGTVDAVINNVGDVAREQMSWRDMTEESVDHVLAVDIKGTMACTHEFGARMLDQGHGAIVNIGSTVIVRGSARAPQYAAAKYGILGLTKSYAHAFAPTVRVNVFAPGFIETAATLARDDWRGGRGDEMRSKTPMGRIPGPEELAGHRAVPRDRRRLAHDRRLHGGRRRLQHGRRVNSDVDPAQSSSRVNLMEDIDLASARELVRRAVDKAEQLGISGAIAVVGASGALVTASRMDEGGAGGLGRARSKAWIAATQKIPSTEHLHRMTSRAARGRGRFRGGLAGGGLPGRRRDADPRRVRPDHRRHRRVGCHGLAVLPAGTWTARYPSSTASPANPEDQVIAYALDVPYVGQHGDDVPRWEARYGAVRQESGAPATSCSVPEAAARSAVPRPRAADRRQGRQLQPGTRSPSVVVDRRGEVVHEVGDGRRADRGAVRRRGRCCGRRAVRRPEQGRG